MRLGSLPPICLRAKGPDVGNWQRFLNLVGETDWNRQPIVVDEDFGHRTHYATRQWQAKNGLAQTGVVSDPERRLAGDQGYIPFLQAKNFTLLYPTPRISITSVIIHTMEAPEKPTTAENVARWFAGPSAPVASAHYCVGQESVIQCVREIDVAWHAPGANAAGIGVEHEGYARQTPEEWADDASVKTLERSARLVAAICKRWGIPAVKLGPQELIRGEKGIAGHVDVTQAFNKGVGHYDPGPSFPWAEYLNMVSSF